MLFKTSLGLLDGRAPDSSLRDLRWDAERQGIVTLHLVSALTDQGRIYDQRAVFYNFQPNAVPEPATLLLLGSGLTGAIMKARRKRKG